MSTSTTGCYDVCIVEGGITGLIFAMKSAEKHLQFKQVLRDKLTVLATSYKIA